MSLVSRSSSTTRTVEAWARTRKAYGYPATSGADYVPRWSKSFSRSSHAWQGFARTEKLAWTPKPQFAPSNSVTACRHYPPGIAPIPACHPDGSDQPEADRTHGAATRRATKPANPSVGGVPSCHSACPPAKFQTLRQTPAVTDAPRHNKTKAHLSLRGPAHVFPVTFWQRSVAARESPFLSDAGDDPLMVTTIIDYFGYVIYAALALLAVWGVYNGILLYRTLMKKTIREPEQFIDQVRDLCEARRYDAALNLCQSPPQWHTAHAQLVAVAIRNRGKGLAKIKQLVVTEFHSEVIAGMENRLGSISTIVRMGPLLGLVGTVAL